MENDELGALRDLLPGILDGDEIGDDLDSQGGDGSKDPGKESRENRILSELFESEGNGGDEDN